MATPITVSNRSLTRESFDGATFVRGLGPTVEFAEAAALTEAVIDRVREVRGPDGVVATSELARITDRVRGGGSIEEAREMIDRGEFLSSPDEARGPLAPLMTMLASFAGGLEPKDPEAADVIRALASVIAYGVSQATLQELPRYKKEFDELLVEAGGKPSFNVSPQYVAYDKPSDATVASVKAFFERRKIDASMVNDFLEGYAEDGGIDYGEVPPLPERLAYVHTAGLERLQPLQVGTLTQYPVRCHEAYATLGATDDVRAQAVPFVFPQRASINPCPRIRDNDFVPDVDEPARIAEFPYDDIPRGFFTIAEAGVHLYTHRHLLVIDPAFTGTLIEDLVAPARKKLEEEREDLAEKAKALTEATVAGLGFASTGAAGLFGDAAKVMVEALSQVVLDGLGGVAAPQPVLTAISIRPVNFAPLVLAAVLLIEPGEDGAVKRLGLNDLKVDGDDFSATRRSSRLVASTRVWLGATAPTPNLGLNLSTHLNNALDEEDDGALAKLCKKVGSVLWAGERILSNDAEKAALASAGVGVGALGSVSAASQGIHILIKLDLPRNVVPNGCYFAFYRIDTRLVPIEFARQGIPIV